MVALEQDRLPEDINRLPVPGRMFPARPEVFYPVLVLTVKFIEIRHTSIYGVLKFIPASAAIRRTPEEIEIEFYKDKA